MGCLLRAGQGRGARSWTHAAVPEAVLVEGLALAQHVVHRTPQLGRQDGQRLAAAALRRLLLLPLLGPFAPAHEQARRLRERPAQMGVADLLAARAELFACRLMGAA